MLLKGGCCCRELAFSIRCTILLFYIFIIIITLLGTLRSKDALGTRMSLKSEFVFFQSFRIIIPTHFLKILLLLP